MPYNDEENSGSGTNGMGENGKPWIADEALEAMIMEREYHPKEDNAQTSRRIVNENAPVVVQSLIHLAIHSSSERIRLDAGKYLTDRVLGKVGEESSPSEDSPIVEFLKDVRYDIESLSKNGIPNQ